MDFYNLFFIVLFVVMFGFTVYFFIDYGKTIAKKEKLHRLKVAITLLLMSISMLLIILTRLLDKSSLFIFALILFISSLFIITADYNKDKPVLFYVSKISFVLSFGIIILLLLNKIAIMPFGIVFFVFVTIWMVTTAIMKKNSAYK